MNTVQHNTKGSLQQRVPWATYRAPSSTTNYYHVTYYRVGCSLVRVFEASLLRPPPRRTRQKRAWPSFLICCCSADNHELGNRDYSVLRNNEKELRIRLFSLSSVGYSHLRDRPSAREKNENEEKGNGKKRRTKKSRSSRTPGTRRTDPST